MFTIGGLSGDHARLAAGRLQQTDTYFVVAHFHYVLFGGSLFGLFAGDLLLVPEDDAAACSTSGWASLALLADAVGFNLTFFPMHYPRRCMGMPRRIYTYAAGPRLGLLEPGLDHRARSASGSRILAVHRQRGREPPARARAPADPWDGRTLEWRPSSPPPAYNFDAHPARSSRRDALWPREASGDARGSGLARRCAGALTAPAGASTCRRLRSGRS